MREFEFSYHEITGLGPEPGVMRRDNSDVIKVDGLYHIWYSKGLAAEAPFPDYPVAAGWHARVWHATSPDGFAWTERECAIDKGPAGSLEEGGGFTPNVFIADGRYWMGYCGIAKHTSLEESLNTVPDGEFLAVADSPFGPWTRVGNGPFLWPVDDPACFDSFRVDGLSFIRRNGENWVYYKGRQLGRSGGETKLGLATASSPADPWQRYAGNPVLNSGHEVMFWPYREGVATFITYAGEHAHTVQYASDGVDFQIVGKAVNPPDAPSHYCPDCWDDSGDGKGIDWGICMVRRTPPDVLPYLRRWECKDLRF